MESIDPTRIYGWHMDSILGHHSRAAYDPARDTVNCPCGAQWVAEPIKKALLMASNPKATAVCELDEPNG